MVATPCRDSPKTEKMGERVTDSADDRFQVSSCDLVRLRRARDGRTEALELSRRGEVDLAEVEVENRDEDAGEEERRQRRRDGPDDADDHEDLEREVQARAGELLIDRLHVLREAVELQRGEGQCALRPTRVRGQKGRTMRPVGVESKKRTVRAGELAAARGARGRQKRDALGARRIRTMSWR